MYVGSHVSANLLTLSVFYQVTNLEAIYFSEPLLTCKSDINKFVFNVPATPESPPTGTRNTRTAFPAVKFGCIHASLWLMLFTQPCLLLPVFVEQDTLICSRKSHSFRHRQWVNLTWHPLKMSFLCIPNDQKWLDWNTFRMWQQIVMFNFKGWLRPLTHAYCECL